MISLTQAQAQAQSTAQMTTNEKTKVEANMENNNNNNTNMNNPYQFMTKKINEHNEWLAKFNDLFIKEISPMDQLENERLLFELNVKKNFNF